MFALGLGMRLPVFFKAPSFDIKFDSKREGAGSGGGITCEKLQMLESLLAEAELVGVGVDRIKTLITLHRSKCPNCRQ